MNKGKGSAPFYWKRKDVRSGLESRVRQDLDSRNVTYEYETLELPYIKSVCPKCGEILKKGKYLPDFIIGTLICEVKGRFTSEDRKKHLSVKEMNPERDIRILFQRDQKLSKASKTRYSEWCTKHKIPYAIGETVPEDWVKDGFK